MQTESSAPFVLIVEDDRDIAEYFRSVMDMAGYRTDVAVSGNQAVDMLFRTPPDILLLDLSLPGVSGAEILRLLGTAPSLSQVRTVVITGYSQMADDLPREPDLVLEKPVSPEQLVDLVRRLTQEGAPIPLPRSWQKSFREQK